MSQTNHLEKVMKKATVIFLAILVSVVVSTSAYADWHIYKQQDKVVAVNLHYNGTAEVSSLAREVQSIVTSLGYEHHKMFRSMGWSEIKGYIEENMGVNNFLSIGVTDAQAYGSKEEVDQRPLIYYPNGATTVIADGIKKVQSLL